MLKGCVVLKKDCAIAFRHKLCVGIKEGFLKLKIRIFTTIGVVVLVFILPNFSNAATLFLSPSSGNYNSGGQMSVSVRINTESEAINAVDGTIGFNPDILEVSSVTKGTAVSLWVQEPSYSNKAGNVNFGGVILNPGYYGSNGNILTINFRAKGSGKAEISFKAGSVLANDGYGTNVLKAMSGASFNINVSSSQQLQDYPAQAPIAISDFEIFSSTHPDQDKWYSNNNPLFKWNVLSGVSEVILVLSRRANSPPIISYSPPISEKLLTDLDEGEWYLNARFRTAAGLGPITSFRFNIDTVVPRPFNIVRLDVDDLTNPRPELLFETSDATSGIDRYELTINGGKPVNILPNEASRVYAMPLQRPGEKTVEIKVIDKAGNSVSSMTKIIVKSVPIPKPKIKDIILLGIEADKAAIIKEETEAGALVREVLVRGEIEQEVLVEEMAAQKTVKVKAVVGDTFKLKSNNILGQISESQKSDELDLIKTIESPTDEDGGFEIKIDDLGVGTYIIRTYGKDERGAVSDTFSDVVLKVVDRSVFTQFVGRISNIFDWFVNLLSGGWFLIAVGMAIASLAILVAKRVIPFIINETSKIKFIASEYQVSKKLKKLDSKTKLELKILEKDIKKELELLNKIASHRSLHSDEQYLRNKLEKYYSILRKL